MKKFITRLLWGFVIAILILLISFIFAIRQAFHTAFGPDNDDFGSKHPIPAELIYNQPMELRDSVLAAPADSLATDSYLQIYNGFQGGIYLYDFHYPSLPAGEIFLRCYEVTENIPLSEEDVSVRSKVKNTATDSFAQLVNKQEFSIYEGVWGDYYAARIEVWHRDATTKKERKLLEKIYRVEGWER